MQGAYASGMKPSLYDWFAIKAPLSLMKASYETVPVSPRRKYKKLSASSRDVPPAFPVYHTEDIPKEGEHQESHTEVFLDHT